MNPAEKILLIRLKSLGDVVHMLPAVHMVRENFPHAQITLLVSREHAPLVEGFREVDRVTTLDRALYRRGNPLTIVGETIALVRRLHRERFSLVVDFQGFGETGLLTWCTRAPQRWGHVHYATRGWAYTRGVRPDLSMHLVDRHLSLLHQCGLRPVPFRNEFVLPHAALEEARGFCREHGCDPAKPILYLQPFTSTGHKNWPFKRFLQLARFWRERGVQVIFSGGPADRSRLANAQAENFIVAAGLPYLQGAGLMKLSTLVVGGDTGFTHLAVALGKRVLMLAQAYFPGIAIPYGHLDWVILPSEGASMVRIEVERVVQATAAAFAECGVRLQQA